MKLKIPILTATLSSFFILHSALGQGALTPPGPPGATMLTLSQVEPRTPISGQFVITNSGSYYLTTNITISTGNAITIATNGVALDLNGFTISSTAVSATGYGILINSGLRNLTIATGFIQGGVTNNGSGVYTGGGFAYGIDYSGTAPVNVLVSRVSVCGCLDDGISLNDGDSTVVESCTTRTMGSSGIVATTIKSSSAIDCGGAGIIGDQVSDCRGQSSGSGYGVYGNDTALNCYGSSVSGYGLYANTAENCYGYSISGRGLYAITAQNCNGYSTDSYGIIADNAQNCYGQSSSNDGLYINVLATGCYGYSSTGTGLYAGVVENCYGNSSTGDGLVCTIALNSTGQSSGNGYGLFEEYGIATGCYGYSAGGGTGLYVGGGIATGCYGYSGSGVGITAEIGNSCIVGSGTTSITYQYNMP